MSYEAVDVVVTEKNSPNTPLEGVVVKVFNEAGSLIYGLQTTSSSGAASFLLPVGVYQLRFYKRQVVLPNPQYIEVLEAPVPPESNTFDVLGESFVPPIATDPRLCMASGFFLRPDGSPSPNTDIHFIAKFKPILLDGAALLSERVMVRTDDAGYAQITLVRFGQYDVTVEGSEDYTRKITVPDKLQTNLPDLLFPVVAQITFDPPPPFNVPLTGALDIIPTVISSDGTILEGTAAGDVYWSLGDASIASLGWDATKLTLSGVVPGATTLNAIRADASIIRIPDLAIVGVPASIVVA